MDGARIDEGEVLTAHVATPVAQQQQHFVAFLFCITVAVAVVVPAAVPFHVCALDAVAVSKGMAGENEKKP